MTDQKTPAAAKPASKTAAKAGPGDPGSPGAVPGNTTDPSGVTDQARKTKTGRDKPETTSDGDAGINANVTDLPGHAAVIGKGLELDKDDPGINANVIS